MTLPPTGRGICWTIAALLLFLPSDTTSRLRASAADTTWTIGNSRIQATFRIASSGLLISRIVDPATGAELGAAEEPDSTATINGATAALGSSAGGWTLLSVEPAETDTGSSIVFAFRSSKASIVAERSYAVYADSPTIETWTTFRGTGSQAVTVSNPNVWQLTVPTSALHYEFGLRHDAAGAPVDDAFALQTAAVTAGMSLTFDEPNRSTEQFLPMIAGDAGALEFFGGLAWSGSWQIAAQGLPQQTLRVTAGIPRVSITVDASHPLETPHGFFGFARGSRADVAAALRGFVDQGIRRGRPFQPLVTDNTWFSYGTNIDEETMKDEMTSAARLGAELFVMDAGWYRGADVGGDFATGLGTWEADPARFPDGLGALTDYAHSLGLRFGIWVEPERVDQATVGKPQLAQQSWLASTNGSLGSTTSAQICLASPAARQWVLDRLTRLLDEAHPDYLKWDNNFWLNCNRRGHGHGATDGNFGHVKGLYSVLQALRDRYPDLLIENCAQGGNRADFGMLRYTETAWMDDRTGPSTHVRRNLEGLMTFFPPSYLLSFAINEGNEPLADAPDLPLYLRSRMPGILGLTYRATDLTDDDQLALSREISLYKKLRDVQRDASGTLLTGQAAPAGGGPSWDAVQELSRTTGDAVIFAFQVDGAVSAVSVIPRGLDPAASYEVLTAHGRVLGTATGERLMTDGVTVDESPVTAGRVIRLRADRAPTPWTPASINGAKRDE